MKSSQDRRSPSVVRVSHTALVDICSRAGSGSPFQAESSNISGRGMLLRTSFLPEIGEELVCRFDHSDHEILVEGVVAWRAEGADSGEFGIQFTALDADSADVLQSMGESISSIAAPRTTAGSDEESEESPEDFLEVGSRVRLHIDGLGAPMKACVHEGSARKVRVGSSLEFLKLGRGLEVENVTQGEKRSAHVDAVNVVMNPSTRIPELVVQLRYEGVSPTPAPAQASTEGAGFDDEAFGPKVADFEEHDGDLGEDEPDSWEPAAEAIRARLTHAASSASAVAQKAGGLFSSLARSTTRNAAQSTSRRTQAASREQSQRKLRTQSPDKRRLQTTRRRTSSTPTHLRSGIHDLGLGSKRDTGRGRSARASKTEGTAEKKKRRVPGAAIFGGAFILLAGSAFALRGFSDTETESLAGRTPPVEKAATAETAPKKQIAQAPSKKSEPEADKEKGVVAEVPLFGPQAMAVKKAEPKPSGKELAEAEKRAAAASVEDQSWDEPEPTVETADDKPWGRGRLYLPTIHRIRLDGAGTSLSGAMNTDGFTVVVPGRKAMESGKAIEKRDKRIVGVLTNNNARGATVKFQFRGPVPPYRVRLRQDFLEFLISAPEESVARL